MTTDLLRKLGSYPAFALVSLASVGCSTTGSNTATGAGVGGALGTGAGLAIGAATRHPLLGAAVGGLTGAGLGAAVGSSEDAKERQQARDASVAVAQAQAQAQGARMGMMDVVKMVQSGLSDDIIINQIRSTGSTFQLSANDLAYLKQCNVSDNVIQVMQSARPAAPVVYAAPPPYYAPPPGVVYVRPYRYGYGYPY